MPPPGKNRDFHLDDCSASKIGNPEIAGVRVHRRTLWKTPPRKRMARLLYSNSFDEIFLLSEPIWGGIIVSDEGS